MNVEMNSVVIITQYAACSMPALFLLISFLLMNVPSPTMPKNMKYATHGIAKRKYLRNILFNMNVRYNAGNMRNARAMMFFLMIRPALQDDMFISLENSRIIPTAENILSGLHLIRSIR